jgi:hypothetical protein
MKKMLLLLALFCLPLSACMPAILQTPASAPNPAPISNTDIQATVAVSVQQTLESMPTPTLAPSDTPVVMTATSAPTLTPTQSVPTSTGTQNPLTTLTVTPSIGTGTVIVTVGTVGTLPFTSTPNPAFSATPTATNHYQYYGTMPPNLPSGKIELINMSKADSYISLQCTTIDGYVTIIEYPVGRSSVKTGAPAGRYIYVAWVGGKKFTGNFKLSKLGEVTIVMNKDRVTVK